MKKGISSIVEISGHLLNVTDRNELSIVYQGPMRF